MSNMPFAPLNATAYMPLSNFMGCKLAYPEATADRNCHSCRLTPRLSLFGVLDQCLQRPKGLTCRQGLLMISINTHSLLPLRASALASLPPTFVELPPAHACRHPTGEQQLKWSGCMVIRLFSPLSNMRVADREHKGKKQTNRHTRTHT